MEEFNVMIYLLLGVLLVKSASQPNALWVRRIRKTIPYSESASQPNPP